MLTQKDGRRSVVIGAGMLMVTSACGSGAGGPNASPMLKYMSMDGGTIPPNAAPDAAIFRSYDIHDSLADGGYNCSNPPPSGFRPKCANMVWTASGCVFKNLNTGCACYEGQAQACDPVTLGPCRTGVGCGVQVCIATSDTTSYWYNGCFAIK